MSHRNKQRIKQMTTSQELSVSKKIAKALVCVLVLILTIPGITLLTISSVVVWFYGQDLLSGAVMSHFKFIEKFLPSILVNEEL